MLPLPKTQTAVIQSRSQASPESKVPLTVASGRQLPQLQSEHDVLVQVLAAGLNPLDHKIVSRFYQEGRPVGCDFCGRIVIAGPCSGLSVGDRIITGIFPDRTNNGDNGAFAQFAVGDARRALKCPDSWSSTTAAGLGLISWVTAGLAMSKPDALALSGRPSAPTENPVPVLVYGGGTATGIVAIQILKQSGYIPIAVCSDKSAARAVADGAIGTVSYTSLDCVDKIRNLAGGLPIKYALDCITNPDSVRICFEVLARVGARLVTLEDCPESWRSRRSVKVTFVTAYDSTGHDVNLGDDVYDRKANPLSEKIAKEWLSEVQVMIDNDSLRPLDIRELDGLPGIVRGLEEMCKGQVRGNKLASRVTPQV